LEVALYFYVRKLKDELDFLQGAKSACVRKGSMYADARPVALFSFSVYDLSGTRVGPSWERFIRCHDDGKLDWEELYEQVEILLDYAGVELMERVRFHEWDNYTTHRLPDWKGRPAVVRGWRVTAGGGAGSEPPD
jgi:hypothetical protein